MWSLIINALIRMAVSLVVWIEHALPVMLPAGIAAFLYGKHFGYRGAALRLFVMTGMLAAVVGTPVVLSLLGLDISLWKTVVCCTLSVFCWEGVRWLRIIIMRKLGLEPDGETGGKE